MQRPRTWALLIATVLIAAAMAIGAQSATAVPNTATFKPVADAYTSSDKPTTNFGTSTTLRVDANPVSTSYLRFDVQGLGSRVTKATLRVYSNTDASSKGADLRSVASSAWGETTLNYSNRPATGSTIVSHTGAFTPGQWISFDATSLVTGNGLVSMALTTTSTTSRGFQSREVATNAPQLIVETADATPPGVTLTAPANGSSTSSATPTFSGAAGTVVDDSATVRVKVYAGALAIGIPVRLLTTTRTGASWSADATPALSDGVYTAQAEQSDAAGNTGFSSANTFVVAAGPVEPPPVLDTTPPAVSLATPADGSSIGDATPTFSGGAGTESGDAATVTVNVYAGTSASGTPVQSRSADANGSSWSVDASPPLALGTYTARAEQTDLAGNRGVSSANTFTVRNPVVLAAGDIACDSTSPNYNAGLGTSNSCHQKATSDLLANPSDADILALGDTQYENAAYDQFQQVFDPTWGRFKSRIHPVAGNHEYQTPAAAGYFDYFNGIGNTTGPAGERGKGYYSFDVGTWHLIALNSNCPEVGGCAAGSPQEQWLRADLAAHPNACTLAFWHHPLFSSGMHGNNLVMAPIWQAIYEAHADVVLTGHDHLYERYGPQSASGAPEPARGVREFVVGTGGQSHYTLQTVQPNSAIRSTDAFGVLKLTLRGNGYDWQFLPEAGQTFTDSGSAQCDVASTDSAAPTAPSNLGAALGQSSVGLTWTASSDNEGVAGYRVFRNGTQIASPSVPYYSDTSVQPGTTYSYYVVAYDASGNVSSASNTASVSTPASGQVLTFAPSADTYVYSTNANTNYGASTTLQVDNSPVKHILLKFSVSGIAGRPVTSAKLRLYAVDPSPVGGEFRRTATDTWTEPTVTWATAPAADTAILATLGKVSAGNWYEVDVTPFVTGDGVVSMRVTSSSSDGADYSSKEGPASFVPQLVVAVP
jgi:hypothetical protein